MVLLLWGWTRGRGGRIGLLGKLARVVVVTALCDPQVEAEALGWGASAMLLKTEAIAQLPQLLKPW